MGVLDAQLDAAGSLRSQGVRQHRIDRTGPAQFGQQQFVGPVQPPTQSVAALPYLVGRDEQAGILDRLQPEFQPPSRGVVSVFGRRIDRGVSRIRSRGLAVRTLGRRIDEAEGQPALSHLAAAELLPGCEAVNEFGHLVRVGREAGIRPGECLEPGLGRRRPARRATPPPWKQVGVQQPRAHRRIGQGGERTVDQTGGIRLHRVVRLVHVGTAHRRHRGRQRVKDDDVRPLQDRPPAGLIGVLVGPGCDRGQDASPLGEVASERGHCGEVVHRGPVACRGAGQVENVQGRGGVETDHRQTPREQHSLTSGVRAEMGANQLGRVQRRSAQ